MKEFLRCPRCGALNPAEADWCNQCLARFTPPPAPGSDAPEPEAPSEIDEGSYRRDVPLGDPLTDDLHPAEHVAVAAGTASVEGAEAGARMMPAEAVGTVRGAFKVTPTGVVWICASCETENSMNDPYCSVCGASFADTVRPAEAEGPPRDAGTAAMLSLFLPGAGHGYLGNWGQAVARGVVSVWAIAVAIVAFLQEDVPTARLISILFLLIAFGLWIVAAHDAYREANGERSQVILRPRYFVYLVLGMLLFLGITLTAALLSAA